MTARIRKGGKLEDILPDGGRLVCLNCTAAGDACDELKSTPAQARAMTREPRCLINYLWRNVGLAPAQALRLGDAAAVNTLTAELSEVAWKRAVGVYEDRARFVAGLD